MLHVVFSHAVEQVLKQALMMRATSLNGEICLYELELQFGPLKNEGDRHKMWSDVYQLNANESIQVGMAIGGIDNDIPFDAIKIVKSKDTVSAIGLEDVKRLFEHKMSGNLKKPYVISIK